MVKLAQLDFPSSTASIVTLRSTAERQGQEVYGVLRAVAKALRIYKSDRELAVRAVSRFMRSEDREALEETWRLFAEVYKDIPIPSVRGIRTAKDFLEQGDPEVRQLNLDRAIDTQFTDRLQKEMGR